MKFFAIVGIAAIFIATSGNCYSDENSQPLSWPTVLPAQVSVSVTSENAKVILDVYSSEGKREKLYQLRCNKGDSEDKAENEDDYYPMWQCHFIQIGNSGPELLEGEYHWSFGKSYNTRGRFTHEQLIGPCKDDPEFGFHREFNMRRMKLELTILNFIAPPIADMITEKTKPSFSFDFQAKVSPNESALSAQTSPSAKKYCGGYYEINSEGKAIYREVILP